MRQITYKKIIVTHDGSDIASHVLPHAFSLALSFNSEILILRVINSVEQEIALASSTGMYPGTSLTDENVFDIVAANKKKAKQEIEKIKEILLSSGAIHVRTKVAE